jgi:hypothetical protein
VKSNCFILRFSSGSAAAATSFCASQVREQFTGALAGVMQKPYTASRLREKIAEVLTSKGALVEAARMGLSAKPAVRNASR